MGGCEAGEGQDPEDEAERTAACATRVRRFAGPRADELAILCGPAPGAPDPARQAEAGYRALAALLAAEGASFLELTQETLFLRDIRRDLPLVLEARDRVLAALGQSASAPTPAFIGQAPLHVAAGFADVAAGFAIAASAVVPRDREGWSVRDVRSASPCACEGCARSGARVVQLGGDMLLQTTNLYGRGGDAFEQTRDAFRAAEHLLERCGMGFRNVVRTWIHLRDIDRDYAALNRARREFFGERGVAPRPASTGVEGAPFPDAHDVSLRLHAVRSAQPLGIAPISSPLLNEAWSYGADFSRGLRLEDANKVTLHLSGTASIDEAGRTVHEGDFEAQASRMLDNVASLLAAQGAGFEDLVSAVTYLKHPADAAALRSICRSRGFGGFPWAVVEAALCRPGLLCETEAVALLPSTTRGA